MALPRALWVTCAFCMSLIEAKVEYWETGQTRESEDDGGEEGVYVELQAFAPHKCGESA